MGRVDLGTLTWNYNALGEPSYFYASIANAVNSINVSCSLYESAVVLPTNTEDKIICITRNQVRIRDNELEGSIVDLNTKLNGVYLYYELETPIETDISSYITKDTLEVVEGGTLEFLNTYNQSVPNEIAYLFNAVTLNNVVDSNGNPRFIEGDGTPATITGFTATQCKWSLSGTHLMLVYALTLDSGAGLTNRADICSFELPQWILDKIYPLSNELVDIVDAIYVPDGGTPTKKEEWLYKTATGLKITNKLSIQATNKCYFRIQFDILIDSE